LVFKQALARPTQNECSITCRRKALPATAHKPAITTKWKSTRHDQYREFKNFRGSPLSIVAPESTSAGYLWLR
jgi:hypothetical protein